MSDAEGKQYPAPLVSADGGHNGIAVAPDGDLHVNVGPWWEEGRAA